MKKVFVILGVALTMFSCSDDDETFISAVNSNELVGRWTLVSQIEDNVVVNIDDCDRLSSITFTESTVLFENVSTNNAGECIESEVDPFFDYTVENITITFTDSDGVSTEGFISIGGSNEDIVQLNVELEDGVDFQRSYRFDQ